MCAEKFPTREREKLMKGRRARAVGGVARLDEVKWSLEEESRVGKRNGVGPSDILGGVGYG